MKCFKIKNYDEIIDISLLMHLLFAGAGTIGFINNATTTVRKAQIKKKKLKGNSLYVRQSLFSADTYGLVF